MDGFLLVTLAVTLQKTPTLASELLQRDLPAPAEAADLDRSMVHFAPAHAEVPALYHPRIDRERMVYPSMPLENERGIERAPGTADEWVDRSFSEVKKGFAIRDSPIERSGIPG